MFYFFCSITGSGLAWAKLNNIDVSWIQLAGTTCQPEEAADRSWFCVLLNTFGPAMSCFNLKSLVVRFVISCHILSCLIILGIFGPQYSTVFLFHGHIFAALVSQWFPCFSMFLPAELSWGRGWDCCGCSTAWEPRWTQQYPACQAISDETMRRLKWWRILPQTPWKSKKDIPVERFESFMDKFGYPEEWKETRKLSKAKFYHPNNTQHHPRNVEADWCVFLRVSLPSHRPRSPNRISIVKRCPKVGFHRNTFGYTGGRFVAHMFWFYHILSSSHVLQLQNATYDLRIFDRDLDRAILSILIWTFCFDLFRSVSQLWRGSDLGRWESN